MPVTVLVVDGIATNRVMLKVQLSASQYHVVQSDRLDGIEQLVRRTTPDLIVTAMRLPDGNAITLKARMRSDRATADIPILAITPENDRQARLNALQAGIDDAMAQPFDDQIFQARIRNLLRHAPQAEDLASGESSAALGFGELPQRAFSFAPRVAILARSADTGVNWVEQLSLRKCNRFRAVQRGDIGEQTDQPPFDAYVIEVSGNGRRNGLHLLADLRARAATRTAALIAVAAPSDSSLAAEALDRGANDAMPTGFCAEELSLRLTARLREKVRADHLRDTMRNGLRAALIDPMTGLYNRRYALPYLNKIAQGPRNGTSGRFALMLADLDHFKRINDRFGHLAGDAVLVETAARLRKHLRPDDMIARVGGEEFMIVMPDMTEDEALRAADRMCQQINARPFPVPGLDTPISVSISIGLVMAQPPAVPEVEAENRLTDMLIGQADRALYSAKDAGRNKVTMAGTAA